MDPNTGMGMRNYPMMAPDTVDPRVLPVEITMREIGAIFLRGVLLWLWIRRVCSPNPPKLKNSPNMGIYWIIRVRHPLFTAVSPKVSKYSLNIYISFEFTGGYHTW
jgi:hypothetical protein